MNKSILFVLLILAFITGLALMNIANEKPDSELTKSRDSKPIDKLEEAWEWYFKGEKALKVENYDDAIKNFKRAIAVKPDFEIAYYNLGIIYAMKGFGSLAADYFYQSGLICLEKGDKEGVLKAYGKIKKTNSKELEQDLFKKLKKKEATRKKYGIMSPLARLYLIFLAIELFLIVLISIAIIRGRSSKKVNESILQEQELLQKFLNKDEVLERCLLIPRYLGKVGILYATKKKLIMMEFNRKNRFPNPNTCKEITYDSIHTISLVPMKLSKRIGLRITLKDKADLYLETRKPEPLKKICEVINERLNIG